MKIEKQYRYRIYTEDRGRDKIQNIVADCFDGFTMFFGVGVWENKTEKNLTIEIITTLNINESKIARATIQTICKRINRLNSQDCCLVTIEPVEIAYV